MSLIFVGIFYLWLIPESVDKEKCKKAAEDSNNNNRAEEKDFNIVRKVWISFTETNKLFVETLKYIFR